MEARYDYAYGFKTAEAAWDRVDDYCAAGDLTMAERPKVEPYKNREGKTRYKITLPMA